MVQQESSWCRIIPFLFEMLVPESIICLFYACIFLSLSPFSCLNSCIKTSSKTSSTRWLLFALHSMYGA